MLVDYALKYAQKGFYVIPIKKNTKMPLCKFADKRPLSRDEIIYYWNRYKDAQIALRTVNHFVIDVDTHNGINGLKSLKDHVPHYKEWFKNTYTEKTKSGGFHVYFAKPTYIKISQHIGIIPGVDIKAHINNYTLVAPSVGYQALNRKPIISAPSDLLEWLKNASLKDKNTSPVNFESMNFIKGSTAKIWDELAKKPENQEFIDALNDRQGKAPHYLDILLNGLGIEGQRNNLLTSFVGYLVLINVDYSNVYKLAIIANSNSFKPLGIKEVNNTVLSIIRRDAKKWNN